MSSVFVRENAKDSFSLGNEAFAMTVGRGAAGMPVVTGMKAASRQDIDFSAPGRPLAPVI